jgi:hypothetical protein
MEIPTHLGHRLHRLHDSRHVRTCEKKSAICNNVLWSLHGQAPSFGCRSHCSLLACPPLRCCTPQRKKHDNHQRAVASWLGQQQQQRELLVQTASVEPLRELRRLREMPGRGRLGHVRREPHVQHQRRMQHRPTVYQSLLHHRRLLGRLPPWPHSRHLLRRQQRGMAPRHHHRRVTEPQSTPLLRTANHHHRHCHLHHRHHHGPTDLCPSRLGHQQSRWAAPRRSSLLRLPRC